MADTEDLQALGAHIVAALSQSVQSADVKHGELTIYGVRDHITELLRFLIVDSQCKFESLIDLAGVDYPERSERFEVVYHLLSMRLNQRIRVKISTNDDTPVPSIVDVFPCADWYEREAFDMYGIAFSGHPDLRRILTDYGFEGHPMRKDFPLTGHVEVRYDDLEKRVVYEPVTLTQEYRDFDFLSPWEGMNKLVPGEEKATAATEEGAE